MSMTTRLSQNLSTPSRPVVDFAVLVKEMIEKRREGKEENGLVSGKI